MFKRALWLLYRLWYWLIFGSLTAASALACLAASFFSGTAARYISSVVWSYVVFVPAGIRLRVWGRENLPPGDSAFIIYANHCSMTDIPTVSLASGRLISWVAKASLARIPFFGWALRRVHILVEPGGGPETARKMVADAEAKLSAGEVLAIFPEGTRNTGDTPLLPFKKGTFMLARHTGHLLLPLAIKGSRHCWPVGRLWPSPGLIRVKVGQPLRPQKGENLTQLTERAERALAELLAEPDW